MSAEAFAYIAGSAGSEATKTANREAFDRWKIKPRMLRGVSDCNTETTLFGRTFPAPFLLAPIGVLEVALPEADLAVARAVAAEKMPFTFSSQASASMEACSKVMGDMFRWFQLYWRLLTNWLRVSLTGPSNTVVRLSFLPSTRPMLGWRPRDLDLEYLPFM